MNDRRNLKGWDEIIEGCEEIMKECEDPPNG
jgi:hypothetical protein